MINPQLKRALGQMINSVQVVGATHNDIVRAYCSHWVSQVAFDSPVVMASVSPKHDTYPLMVNSGRFGVSILAGDQIDVGQYFSYPGRKFRHIANEWLTIEDDVPVVPNCIAWLKCEVFERKVMRDHELFFAEVVNVGYGRLKEPPLLYSSRHGWRITGERARKPGESVRDALLERLAAAGYAAPELDTDDD
ncbi:MAG: flavin reductase family protein [Acidimicrobiia bacterium]